MRRAERSGEKSGFPPVCFFKKVLENRRQIGYTVREKEEKGGILLSDKEKKDEKAEKGRANGREKGSSEFESVEVSGVSPETMSALKAWEEKLRKSFDLWEKKQSRKEEKKAKKREVRKERKLQKFRKKAEKKVRKFEKKSEKARQKAAKKVKKYDESAAGMLAGGKPKVGDPVLLSVPAKQQNPKFEEKEALRRRKEQEAFEKAGRKRLAQGKLTMFERFEQLSFEELEQLLIAAKTREERSFYRSLLNLKLQIEQEKVIGEVLL